MNKLSPYFPARAFEPSPAFCAWLDLFAAGFPATDRMTVEEMMAVHAAWAAKLAKAAAKRGSVWPCN